MCGIVLRKHPRHAFASCSIQELFFSRSENSVIFTVRYHIYLKSYCVLCLARSEGWRSGSREGRDFLLKIKQHIAKETWQFINTLLKAMIEFTF